MQKGRRLQNANVLLIIGTTIGIVLSFTTYIGVETTANAAFCGSCHTMRPFVASYGLVVHGGNNPFGFRARCTDCHLPHDNLPHYLAAKAETGLNDVWVESFGDAAKIDWAQKAKDPDRYVYDSGCLKCHGNLRRETLSNPRAFLPHRAYFAGTTTRTCVDCHSNVGHKYLAEFIRK